MAGTDLRLGLAWSWHLTPDSNGLLQALACYKAYQSTHSPTRLETVEELPEAAQDLSRQLLEPFNLHASWQQQCNSLSFVW